MFFGVFELEFMSIIKSKVKGMSRRLIKRNVL